MAVEWMAGEIRFRPVTASDYPVIRAWLELPHIREWWGAPDEELGHIRTMVEGRDTTRPFVIELGDRPVGYIQYWFVSDQQTATAIATYPWLAELPADAVGVDLSIGDPALIGRGLGSAALAAFTRKLVGEGFETIVIDPDAANTRAVRAYSNAGYAPVPDLAGRTGDTLIMQYQPEARPIP
ncbi:aminoglycoside 6'-N-acetyltransferase [Amaricoccus macauensis]|uniref:Aminoglycoside 6'-N-acetyltransferase n=1 Tax=Amaricoccus macauensis TaxID=57001 RepID=A0A840SXF1_9RHOB|nr:GNAT family N-acetyltransferase [Amaricoccus macauensis]MBB5223893.1 aminoglycoside 6'-N-acetyltransferase [Amaricoccus macauensis]